MIVIYLLDYQKFKVKILLIFLMLTIDINCLIIGADGVGKSELISTISDRHEGYNKDPKITIELDIGNTSNV